MHDMVNRSLQTRTRQKGSTEEEEERRDASYVQAKLRSAISFKSASAWSFSVTFCWRGCRSSVSRTIAHMSGED